jgi:hypothetical protein
MGVRRLLAALLLVPALVSCSDEEPSSDPTGSPSPTVSVTETPTGPLEPVMPEAAKKPTKAGAVAFVKHYWATVHYAQFTGETQQLTALASESCELCTGGRDSLRKLHDRGGRIVGEAARVVRPQASVVEHRPGGTKVLIAHVRHQVDVPRTVEFYGKGDPRNKVWPAGRRRNLFLMAWEDDASTWQLSQWTLE